MRARLEAVRGAFWLLSAIGVPTTVVAGFALTELERHVHIDLGLFGLADQASARAVLQTIATATVSVAGLSFSVTLVALTLAAQQLSPRVLRTFRSDRVAQTTLASFLGTFAYALIVLARLGEVDATRVPALAVAVAILLALLSFGLFVAFIGDIVVALQASTIIQRIGDDATQAIRGRSPRGIGAAPENAARASRVVEEHLSRPCVPPLVAAHAGYLTHIDRNLIDLAASNDAFLRQCVDVGDYVLTGQTLADVWTDELAEDAREGLTAAFRLAPERTIAADVQFPVRQLADIALRALSPGVNDPTTAQNAMSALTDVLIRCADDDGVELVRVDDRDAPRLLARTPSFDDLVQLGFEQVRRAAGDEPVIARHLYGLLQALSLTDRGAASATVKGYLSDRDGLAG